MNHCYRLVFNKSSQVWQVVSETAKSHSKSAAVVLLPLFSLLPNMSAWAEPALNALPTGGQVVSGQSAMTQNGSQLNILQSTQKSIINWNTYNIGANAQVTYVQPNASAISLNRVISGNPSEIFGKLNSNGQVWLINPNGVLFGKNAQVNVGGIVATTLNIADEDFLNGKYQFTGNAGSVINMGSIVASNGGYVAMLAPEVRNEGVISAMQGTVAMAAGNAMTLDFNGNGLINVQVDSTNVNTLVENKHLIQVGNGQVLMSTKAADGLITSVINNSGKIEANSMVSDGGVIRLTGAKTVINSGEISATSSSQKGGTVHLLGDNVGMFGTSSVNVSGKTGGGTILVGGDYQGKNANIQNATKTFIHQDAQLIADATDSGDGGKVIVWANDIARYYGSVSAKGGAVAGNGGFVEISGKRLLNFFGNVDLSAANGVGGNLLLDPTNITLSNAAIDNTAGFNPNVDNTEAFTDDAGLDSVFNVGAGGSFSGITAGSTITLQATNDITVTDAFNVATATGSANNSLVLEANNDIHVNAAITLDGTGALTLKADADDSGAGNVAIGANITTQGGNLVLEGHNITHSAGNIATTDIDTTVDTNAGNITITANNAVLLGSASIAANGSKTTSVGRAGGIINITANAGIETGAISANASNAAVDDADGGNAGFITINNLVSGDIKINGELSARTGTSTGTLIGVGGVAGEIVINNQADTGNVTTGRITLSAQNKANGGNVVISSKADVTINGTINTSVVAPVVPLNNVAGRNAGNITITGVNRAVTGAITANGGSGGATNQAGGNAGVVSITGTGTLTTAAISAKTGNANDTGAGGLAGSVTLSGSQVTSTAINTSLGTNGTGGNVNITTTGSGSSSIASINANNLGAININNADTLTVSGVIAGDGTTVTKSGTGSLIFAGTNTYTGGTVINAGVLQVGNGATSGSIVNTGNITNNATVIFNRSDAHGYGGVVSGTGILEKSGTGVFTLSGSNTYTGATKINAGTLTLSAADRIHDASALTVASGATFDLNSYAETVGSIAGAGSIMMGTAALTSGGNNTSTTFSGAISGTGGNFNKVGSGTLTLSGNNTYTGATNVQGGTLTVAHANALGATTGGTSVASGAILNVSNVTLAAEAITLANTAALTGTDAAVVTGNVSAGDNSKIGTTSAASTLTINGVLTSGVNNTLEIIGAGSVLANNALNDLDIVKITSAKDVTLHDVNSMSFSAAGSNLTGNLTAIAVADIALNGTITSTTGDILLTSDTFTNNAGANALTAGRWVVHTDTLAGNTYGALVSGKQAIYGRALGVATTEAGNRYVFVHSPTLDITSIDQTKAYGQDVTALVANAYTATPFINAATYGNVFMQDTAANSLTGSATSVGSAAATNVGSYAIDVTPITATTGYTLNKSNAGNLTINTATLELNAVTDTKTYDGNTNSSGIVGINGLVGTDTVTSLSQSYASKNVLGTNGSTLNVNTGYTVNDGNGGNNYTVTINSALGTITQAGLSVIANNSTKIQGDANPAFTSNFVGFVGGDTSAVLMGTLAYTTLANAASPAGTYNITPSGVSANNYNISFVDGVLDVTAALLPVTPGNNASGNISVFNNAITRPEQAELTCPQFSVHQPMVNGLDAFGADNVDYEPSISQPLVGGVVANALAATTCLKL